MMKSERLKPKRLKRGDTVAVVSLSWGGLGDEELIHRFFIAKDRLEQEFGLKVVCMEHALKGSEFIDRHPELRAGDLMEAFGDDTVSAVFCAIGGDDTIRILPYIDFDVIRNHPKIFMGYSDSTINHFMMYKAGLVSFYGPSILGEFGDYVDMAGYTKKAVRDLLFGEWESYTLHPSRQWSDDFIPWQESSINTMYRMKEDVHGYEIINGSGTVRGHLLGGCIDVFMMANGTKIWPAPDEWKGAILFIETSEEKPSPEFVKRTLRAMSAQGILKTLNGIIVGKPQGEVYYEEYKKVIKEVIENEENLPELPIFYNVNFGHAKPIAIIPYGIEAELNCENKTIRFLENPTI
ncbi:S66 peptidase family protein [uncultured Clostridium sp.]|uniref:S66 family peptidase n=1 Tax=uncultured Clostridium sp. TaxID=59620 RepID=UPI0025D6747B|nr:S66 peptidase family protein [uncultured Clostridium sp.]